MNIKDIARICKVSKSTVSFVLNNSPLVNEQTRNKILSVIKRYNYIPNHTAWSLVKKNTKSIGLIANDLDNPFFTKLIQSIEKTISKKNYNLILTNSNMDIEKEIMYTNLLSSGKVDGLLIAPIQESYNHFIELQKRKFPFIVLDSCDNNVKVNYVSFDNIIGTFKAIEYLLKLRHRNIVCISSNKIDKYPEKYRIKGYKQALQKYDIKFNRDLIWEAKLTSISQGYFLTKKNINKLSKSVTAIFTFSDLLAVGALKAVKEIGLKVPQDISIIGFDNIEFTNFVEPPLTTVALPIDKLGRLSAEELMLKIENGNLNNRKETQLQINLEAQLVIRKSTGIFVDKKQFA